MVATGPDPFTSCVLPPYDGCDTTNCREERTRPMGPFWGISAPLLLLLLTACVASYPAERTAGRGHPALDLLLTQGQIRFAEARLRDFGFDPGPVDGDFTTETEAAIWAFQRRYGLVASGLLDRATREELKLGVDPKRTD